MKEEFEKVLKEESNRRMRDKPDRDIEKDIAVCIKEKKNSTHTKPSIIHIKTSMFITNHPPT